MLDLGYLLVGLTGGAAVAVTAACVPFVTPALRRVCLPYVPATSQQVENVREALRRAWPHKPPCGRRLVDLGSGDGRVVELGSRLGIPSVGVELNPWLVAYSKVRALRMAPPRPQYLRTDLFKFSLAPFSDVVIFGVEQMMEELEAKMQRELDGGARVVACRFPLPTWTPVAVFGNGVDTVWLYEAPS
ncbi:ATP synthase subunit C lysine N-methyltransferase [Neocloeon triangulifer]|uniref:ATP synthase subunit C lysine N-methyltransferase n=1 Tax=Neocloeon triangulifer TaxID=2078957 RepID=UPI00286F1B3F|nr:ATP synthase subunit C lysine N-methyltransferase [Neocloeon triangulifer]